MRQRNRSSGVYESETECPRANIDHCEVNDVTVEFIYRPHTVSLLLVICLGVVFISYSRDPNASMEDNLWLAARVMITVFLLISTMIMPNGIFTRPHPIIWRVVLGASLVYLLLMTGACFLSLEQARSIMMWMFPDLKTLDSASILSRDYGVDCNVFTFERITSDIDIFVVAHFLGWVVKALLLRHYVLLWVLSVNWEFTEWAFAHILPNLNECWWDSFILDVLICNGLGIHVGWMLCKWLEMREYKWESVKVISSTKGKIKRVVMQFTPQFWTATNWIDYKSPPSRAIVLSFLMVMWQVVELNSFLLKHVFIVKPSHPLTLTRLGLVCIASAPAIRQFYLYTTDSQVKRLGSQMWIFLAIAIVELVVFFQLGSQHYERMIFKYVFYWLLWHVATSFLTVYFCIWWSGKSQKKKDKVVCVVSSDAAVTSASEAEMPIDGQGENDKKLQ